MPGKRQFVVHVNDFGQSLGIRFLSNVPVRNPGEPVESQARTGVRHLHETLVRRVSENSGQKHSFILGWFTVVKVRKAGGEPRPAVHFCEQVRQLDPRQEIIGAFRPFLGGFRHGPRQRCEMEAVVLQSSLRQGTFLSE